MSRSQEQTARFVKMYNMENDPVALRTLPEMFMIYNDHVHGSLFAKLRRTAMRVGRLSLLEATAVAEAFIELVRDEHF